MRSDSARLVTLYRSRPWRTRASASLSTNRRVSLPFPCRPPIRIAGAILPTATMRIALRRHDLDRVVENLPVTVERASTIRERLRGALVDARTMGVTGRGRPSVWRMGRPVAPAIPAAARKSNRSSVDVGDALQRRQRDEAVAAAVAVELEQRVAADHLQAQEAAAERVVRRRCRNPRTGRSGRSCPCRFGTR